MLKKIFSGTFLSLLAVTFICTFFASIVLNILLATSIALQNETTATSVSDQFQEKIISGSNKDNKILIVSVEGMIADNGPSQYTVNSDYIKKIFEQAAKETNIKGILLKVNSPGGTITATDKMYKYIMEYKAKAKVPVVVYFDEVAASGGYYIAMTGDYIISHPTTITGSIGVIMSFYQAQDLLENKLGIKSIVIKSGLHKDIGSSSRPITEKEREILDSILAEMYASFLDKVRQGRKDLKEMSDEELRAIADGRIYTGKQALDKKLVDELGYFDSAKQSVCKLAGLKMEDVSFVELQKPENLLTQLLKANTPLDGKVQQFIQNKFNPKFYYLWCY